MRAVDREVSAGGSGQCEGRDALEAVDGCSCWMLRDCVLGCSRVIIKVVTISIVAGPRFVVKHTCSNAEIEPAARGIILHPQHWCQQVAFAGMK